MKDNIMEGDTGSIKTLEQICAILIYFRTQIYTEDFCIIKMLQKLERFYFNCLGPVIILKKRG